MEYVYFFRQVDSPFVKIGMTKNDISSRFIAFKTYSPLGAYIVGYIETKDSKALESKLHEKLSEKRMSGEFFQITDSEVYSIINSFDISFGRLISEVNELVDELGMDKTKIFEMLRKERRKEIEKANKEEVRIELKDFLDTLSNVKLSSTEIKELFEERTGLKVGSVKKFGMDLVKILGKSKPVKQNGVVKRVYFIK